MWFRLKEVVEFDIVKWSRIKETTLVGVLSICSLQPHLSVDLTWGIIQLPLLFL